MQTELQSLDSDQRIEFFESAVEQHDDMDVTRDDIIEAVESIGGTAEEGACVATNLGR